MTRYSLDVYINDNKRKWLDDNDDNDGDGSRGDDDFRHNISPIFPVWSFSGHPPLPVSQCILSFLTFFLTFQDDCTAIIQLNIEELFTFFNSLSSKSIENWGKQSNN